MNQNFLLLGGRRRTFGCLAAGALSLLLALPAAADSVGFTSLVVTSFQALTGDPPGGAGLDVLPVGDTEIFVPSFFPSDPVAFFPVTGFGAGGELLHEGSGLRFEANGSFLESTNYVIGPAGLTGDIETSTGVTSEDFLIFNFAACDGCVGLDGTITLSGIELLISEEAGALLTDVFGAPDLAGLPGGVANSTYIPEPATAALLGGALAGLALARRRLA